MSSEKRREGSSGKAGWRARLPVALFLAGVLAAVASPAQAVTFYKWTDSQGQVHYGDAPPKEYASVAQRVDVDTTRNVATPPRPPVQPAVVPEPPTATPDLLTQRRLTRDRLEKNLEQARERLDLARKALAETVGPQEGEQQVTQGQPLSAPLPGQSNCRTIATPDGARVVCPHLVPNEQYYERIDKLQESVRLAEQAVEEAEQAYRRGVD
jgi:hypothetical protein